MLRKLSQFGGDSQPRADSERAHTLKRRFADIGLFGSFLQGGFPLVAHGFPLTTAEPTTKEAILTTPCG